MDVINGWPHIYAYTASQIFLNYKHKEAYSVYKTFTSYLLHFRCERNEATSGRAICSWRVLRHRNRKCLRWKCSIGIWSNCCYYDELSSRSSRYNIYIMFLIINIIITFYGPEVGLCHFLKDFEMTFNIK